MAQVIMPERRNKTKEMLDTILTGLSIAEKAHGLLAPDETKKLLKEQSQLEVDKEKRLSQGILSPSDQATLMQKGMTLTSTKPEGVEAVQFKTQDGSPLFAYVKGDPAKKSPLMQIPGIKGKDGREAVGIYDPDSRAMVNEFTKAEDKAKAPDYQLVPTVNDKGEKGQMVVDKRSLKPGQVIPTGEKTEEAKLAGMGIEGRIQKMGGEERKRLDLAIEGYKASKALQAGFAANPGRMDRFSIVGDNDYTMAKAQYIEALGRLNSGGVISNDEINSFSKQIPTPGDSMDIARAKLRWIDAQMENKLKIYGGTSPQELAQAGYLPSKGNEFQGSMDRAQAIKLELEQRLKAAAQK